VNICFITGEYPPDTGGIATYIQQLGYGLVELGHSVDVITSARGAAITEDDRGVHIHRLGHSSGGRLLAGRLGVAGRRVLGSACDRLLWSYAALRRLRALARSKRIDVIEAPEFMAMAFFVSLGGKWPLVIKLHTPTKLCYQLDGLRVTANIRLLDVIERKTAANASLILAPSAGMAQYVRKEWRIDNKLVRVIPNPMDQNIFCQKGDGTSERIVLYVGRLEKRKGVQILIKAFGELAQKDPAVSLYLVGRDTRTFELDGRPLTCAQYIDSSITDSFIRKRIVLCGGVERRRLVDFYHRASVVVCPSERFENFPYVVLEAMSCGKPVIASDCGGLAEMIEDGREGVLVRPGDTDALQKSLANLLKESVLCRKLGAAGREKIEKVYAREVVVPKMLDAYEEAIALYKQSARY
jgi:glycosyltransferase involved in cell wall biosynthesis